MFTAAHLRQPRRDRAILAGSLVALVALAWATPLAVGGVAVPGASSATPVAPGRCPSRRRCSASAGC